jgi:hypothetical protein
MKSDWHPVVVEIRMPLRHRTPTMTRNRTYDGVALANHANISEGHHSRARSHGPAPGIFIADSDDVFHGSYPQLHLFMVERSYERRRTDHLKYRRKRHTSWQKKDRSILNFKTHNHR